MSGPSLTQTIFAQLQPLFAQDDGFIGSFWFFALGAVILLGLGGLLFYLRNKQEGD
jgi:LPXTG-motif cell wall-anchored protein